MTNYCIISHTHWDREWYLPFENFRMRLVDLIDNLLEILEKDGNFRFHLDAQTIVLEDYLAIRPSRRQVLEEHVKKGRILVGPWYVQNDFYLTSGEATIRNLIIGRSIARSFGGSMNVGYAADQFGLISQLPQILRGFGLDTCVFGRGFSTGKPDPLEFYWRSPDGSEVLCEHMAFWYNNAQRLPEDPEAALGLIRNRRETAEGRAMTSEYLLMNGVDHLEAQENLTGIIEKVRELLSPDERLFQDTLPEFLQRVKADIDASGKKLVTVTGELRRGEAGQVLPGTLSSRADLKLANAECQTEIENVLEPLCAICGATGVREYPSDYMRYLWKLIIENHPHDSICGCSLDAVHRHMHDRFERIRENLTDLTERYSISLLDHVDREGLRGDEYLILVANTVTGRRGGPVPVRVEIPSDEDRGCFDVTAPDGSKVPFVLKSVSKNRGKRVLSPINLPGETEVNVYDLLLDVPEMPGFSYKVFVLNQKNGELVPSLPENADPCVMENEFLRAEIRENGTVDLTDKRTGRTLKGLFLLEDNDDRGDSYVYEENDGSGIVTSENSVCRISVEAENGLESARIVTTEPEVFRSGERKKLSVRMRLSLKKGDTILGCELTVDNTAKDHRLRVLFPTGTETDMSFAGSPFDCVLRDRRDLAQGGRQHPDTGYVGVSENGAGVAVLNQGSYEYEHTADGTLAVTLLRCVGRITGNWENRDRQMETWRTSDSQMQGSYTFRLGVYPFAGDPLTAGVAIKSQEFSEPLCSFARPADRSKFTGGRPFVQIAGLPDLFYRPLENAEKVLGREMTLFEMTPSRGNSVVITAVKGSEDGRGTVVRGYNVSRDEVTATLKTFKKFAHVDLLTPEETYVRSLALGSETASISLRPGQIFTIGMFM
ncbi:MAG: hypothetical protein IJU75_00335 [Clostridia bacterium]|nr:hypothetical protein [Clostridia bacterium]